MSAVAEPTAAPTAPKKGRKLMIIVVGLVFAGAGAAIPMFVNVPSLFAKPKTEKGGKGGHGDGKTVVVPFGDLVVNLVEPRMQRYLRIKIAVLADAESEEEVTALLTKQKAEVKSKLIGYLVGKDIKDVSGTVGVNRLQRELLERVEDVLYPDGHSQIRAILFEEYVIQ
jgi:flagellar FliL protein